MLCVISSFHFCLFLISVLDSVFCSILLLTDFSVTVFLLLHVELNSPLKTLDISQCFLWMPVVAGHHLQCERMWWPLTCSAWATFHKPTKHSVFCLSAHIRWALPEQCSKGFLTKVVSFKMIKNKSRKTKLTNKHVTSDTFTREKA